MSCRLPLRAQDPVASCQDRLRPALLSPESCRTVPLPLWPHRLLFCTLGFCAFLCSFSGEHSDLGAFAGPALCLECSSVRGHAASAFHVASRVLPSLPLGSQSDRQTSPHTDCSASLHFLASYLCFHSHVLSTRHYRANLLLYL